MRKREGESFSDVILRLTEGDRESVTEFVRSLSPELREDLAASVISAKKELEYVRPREMVL